MVRFSENGSALQCSRRINGRSVVHPTPHHITCSSNENQPEDHTHTHTTDKHSKYWYYKSFYFQINAALETNSGGETADIFDISRNKGLLPEIIKKLPSFKIACHAIQQSCEETSSCAVCLQVCYMPSYLMIFNLLDFIISTFTVLTPSGPR